MSISMYDTSVPVFKQMLGALSGVLAKAEAHAVARKIDPDVLVQARLYPDMFPLMRQVWIATDFTKGACARLAGVEVPKFDDVERTIPELQARIAKTIAFIDTLTPAQIEGSEQRDVTITIGGSPRTFNGRLYLLHYALPNFYFHVTTAYDILRHNGLELAKKDFIGRLPV
jgi:hypothetical protein